jgi:hypothetical protein
MKVLKMSWLSKKKAKLPSKPNERMIFSYQAMSYRGHRRKVREVGEHGMLKGIKESIKSYEIMYNMEAQILTATKAYKAKSPIRMQIT